MRLCATKRGVALIWTLLTISILLFVTASMANFIMRESQMSVRIEDSTRAYALAQSGIEWSKSYVSNHMDDEVIDRTVDLDIFSTGLDNVKVAIKKDAGSDKVKIVSEGHSASVGRKLQYILESNPAKEVLNEYILSGGKNRTDKSYDFQFDFWKSSDAPVKFALSNKSAAAAFTPGSGLKTLAVEYGGVDTFKLSACDETSCTSPALYVLGGSSGYASSTTSYAIRIKVRYLEGTAAQMTVYRMKDPGGEFICNGTASIDLSGLDFSMTAASPAYFISDSILSASNAGDGNVLSYGSGYIDNVYVHGIFATP